MAVNTGLFGTRVSFVPLRGATAAGDDLMVPFSKDDVADRVVDARGERE